MSDDPDNVVRLGLAREAAQRQTWPTIRGWLLLRLRAAADTPLWFIRTWEHAAPAGDNTAATLERIRGHVAEYTWAEGCG